MESVKQNLQLILSFHTNQIPLDRVIGLDPDFIDRPQPVQEALLTARIMSAAEVGEPRAQITSISFIHSVDIEQTGLSIPVVKFVIKEGVE